MMVWDPPVCDVVTPDVGVPNDEMFMRRALALAGQAASEGEVPVGAVVVAGGCIVGEGWNQSVTARDPSAHAEILALRQAGKALDAYRLPGVSLYVTLEPCVMCLGAMIHARIQRLVFAAADPKTGACGGALALHDHSVHNHQMCVEGGLLTGDSSDLLRCFFRERRMLRRPSVRLVRLTVDNAHAYRDLVVASMQQAFVSSPAEVIDRHFDTGYAEAVYGIEAAGEAAGLLALLPPEQGVDYPGRVTNEAWLEAFRVDRRFQGRGVGSKALAAIVATARQRYGRLSLTVNLRNNEAEAAYRRFGFSDAGALYHEGPAGPQRILTLDLNKENGHGQGA